MSSYRESQTTVASFLHSIAREMTDGLRQDGCATLLATVALITATLLAATSRYDERPVSADSVAGYRQTEGQFFAALNNAEKTDNDDWRISYFVTADARARAVLTVAKRRWPTTGEAVPAHEDLVRYYELVTEDFAIIRTQMSLDTKMNYMAAWRKNQAARWPVHERWANWLRN